MVKTAKPRYCDVAQVSDPCRECRRQPRKKDCCHPLRGQPLVVHAGEHDTPRQHIAGCHCAVPAEPGAPAGAVEPAPAASAMEVNADPAADVETLNTRNGGDSHEMLNRVVDPVCGGRVAVRLKRQRVQTTHFADEQQDSRAPSRRQRTTAPLSRRPAAVTTPSGKVHLCLNRVRSLAL